MEKEKPKYLVEYRNGTKWNQRKGTLYKHMECKICGQMEVIGEDATAVTCSECVIEMWEPINHKKSSGRPRGWTLMKEFVDNDGNVYHRGKEQLELKGKLSPTNCVKKTIPAKRITKKETHELVETAAINLQRLKKQLPNTRWKKDKKLMLSEIKLHTKIVSVKFPRNFDRQKYLDKYRK